MKREAIFNGWLVFWEATIFWPLLLSRSGFVWIVTIVLMVALWFFACKQVKPGTNWKSRYESLMAFNIVPFFGTMVAFLTPCLGGLELSSQLNTYQEIMIIGFLGTINVGLWATLYNLRKEKTPWKYVLVLLSILFLLIWIHGVWIFFC